ncbi:pectate lyase [uncultured Draconibacterium sp.]|uniref:pectate lyase n=1 Tax=uncultured Draconibacterium sp. TaxID=1573823 RepID=UPI0025F15CA7|nr:pectate lyase [uncultured Draconibacterium sp.]
MKTKTIFLACILIVCFSQLRSQTQDNGLSSTVEESMLRATQYMLDSVSYNGGYVWYYLPDFSRQWGEMEAYKTMIWLQHPGTISMGHTFLEAYHATGNEFYYRAAQQAAAAIIWGQSHRGGWNYMIDFAGDRSLKKWYRTIGKNGWRLEEFQHYYGNSTFDDDITSDAARFLLRMYLEKMDPAYKPALEKAIDFILESQYPAGGWPQRYPLMNEFSKDGHPDYTSFYTFNDDVIWENVHFFIQCYETLGQERFLDPILRGMNFYLLSQDTCGAWGQQLTMNMQVAGARTYEPAALLPSTTFENAMLLLKFYAYTGDKKFIDAVPAAIAWLEKTELPKAQQEGARTHPAFVDVKTQRPIYVHRVGANVKYGHYYTDEDDSNLLSHYYGKSRVPLQTLKDEYKRLVNLSTEELTKDSPLAVNCFNQPNTTPQKYYDLNRFRIDIELPESEIRRIVESLDDKNRWLQKHAYISHPYTCDGTDNEQTEKYATTRVGDETDTSPFPDNSDQLYISTRLYIRNMHVLINYLKNAEHP